MGRMGKPLHFKGSSFHRVIPDFMCQVCKKCPPFTPAFPSSTKAPFPLQIRLWFIMILRLHM